ncbi:MAG TPA: tetratricopeptide repeat protein [Alphaproteobacteria bacterium]|nr:tetratricopeptide repeat protein [Alphaproteobacteria bacterium]
MRVLPALLLAFALVAAPAAAGQGDARLPALFERLKQTADPVEAHVLEQLIWKIWFEYPGDDAAVKAALERGNAAMAARDYAAATAAFTAVVEGAPDFAEGWNRRATVHYMAGRFIESAADIAQVLKLEPRHFAALSGLGLVSLGLDKPEAALRAFEQAVAINPHMPGAREHIDMLRRRLAGDPT